MRGGYSGRRKNIKEIREFMEFLDEGKRIIQTFNFEESLKIYKVLNNMELGISMLKGLNPGKHHS